jgi:hypothetical protein
VVCCIQLIQLQLHSTVAVRARRKLVAGSLVECHYVYLLSRRVCRQARQRNEDNTHLLCANSLTFTVLQCAHTHTHTHTLLCYTANFLRAADSLLLLLLLLAALPAVSQSAVA